VPCQSFGRPGPAGAQPVVGEHLRGRAGDRHAPVVGVDRRQTRGLTVSCTSARWPDASAVRELRGELGELRHRPQHPGRGEDRTRGLAVVGAVGVDHVCRSPSASGRHGRPQGAGGHRVAARATEVVVHEAAVLATVALPVCSTVPRSRSIASDTARTTMSVVCWMPARIASSEVAVARPELVVLRDRDVLPERRQLDRDALARRAPCRSRARRRRRGSSRRRRGRSSPTNRTTMSGDLAVGQPARERAAARLVVGQARPGVPGESGRVDDVGPESHDSDPSQM
jgi:hypothetical protein